MNSFKRAQQPTRRGKQAIIMMLALLVSFLGVTVLTAGPSSAHTPGATADCSGIHLKASAYDSSKQNKWFVTIGGQTQSGTFGGSLDKTFAVPQGGATTSWSATIQAYDGSYKGTYSGKVGPCGTSSNPPGQNISCTQIYRDFGRALVNGDHINVTITRQDGSQYQVNVYVDRNIAGGYDTLGLRYSDGTTRPLSQTEVNAGRIWLDLSSKVKDSYYTISFVQINESENWPNKECGTKTKPDKPAPVNKTVSEKRTTCDLGNQERSGTKTTDWTFDESSWTWVAGATTTTWGDWQKVSDLTPAQKTQLGCTKPDKPQPVNEQVKDHRSSCDLGYQERSGTKTTDWTFDESSWTWVAGTSTITWGDWQKVRDLTPAEKAQLRCAVPPPPVVVSNPKATVKTNCHCKATVRFDTRLSDVTVTYRVVYRLQGHKKLSVRTIQVRAHSVVTLKLKNLKHYSAVRVYAHGMKTVTVKVPGKCIHHSPPAGL